MLPAQYRMTRSTDFGVTVRQGVRAAQPDLVVHAWRDEAGDPVVGGPKIGLVVSKSVGTRCNGTVSRAGCAMPPIAS